MWPRLHVDVLVNNDDRQHAAPSASSSDEISPSIKNRRISYASNLMLVICLTRSQ